MFPHMTLSFALSIKCSEIKDETTVGFNKEELANRWTTDSPIVLPWSLPLYPSLISSMQLRKNLNE